MFEPQLSDVEQDALIEFLNLGVGRSAASLEQILHAEITLAIPSLSLLSQRELEPVLAARQGQQNLVVQQLFSGDFCGYGWLVFDASGYESLLRAMLPVDIPPDQREIFMGESLKELANILLNACLGTVAELLSCVINTDPPKLLKVSDEQASVWGHNLRDSEQILRMSVKLTAPSQQVDIDLSLLIEMSDSWKLFEQIHRFISSH